MAENSKDFKEWIDQELDSDEQFSKLPPEEQEKLRQQNARLIDKMESTTPSFEDAPVI